MKKQILFLLAFSAGSAALYAQSGNVGVGTTTPASKLTVSGNASVGTGYAGTAAPANGAIIQGNVGIGTNAPTAPLDIVADNAGNGAGNDLYIRGFSTSKAPGMFTLSSSGTPAAPSNLLNGDIMGTFNIGGYVGGAMQYSMGGMNAIYRGDGNTFLSAVTFFNNLGAERMRIDESGNVGIGTNAPTAKLHVAGTVQVVDGTQGANKVLTSDATGLASWQTPTAAPQYFDWLKTGDALPTTAGDNSVNIYHVGGNVGIGTNAPGTKLDIYNSTTGADIGDDYRFRDESPISNLQSISFDRSNAGNNLASGNVIGVLDFNAKAGGSFVSSTRIQSTYRGNGTNNLSDMIFNVSGNSNEAMRITEALKVGIGTASPSGKLTVSGNGGGVTPILSLTNTNVAGNPTLNIYPGYTSTVTSIAEGNQFAVVFDQDPGQGTAGANQSLYDFHGQVRYQTASALSDRRLKENIYDMKQYGLKEILKMQPRNYTMKASKTKDIGFIAQELKQIVPELVMGQETENSLLSVDYSKVCLVLINAIKEQQAQIEALKTANTGLKAEVSKVAQLSDELNVLKASIEKLTNAQKPELVSAK